MFACDQGGPEPIRFLFTFADIGAKGVRSWLRLRKEFGRGINAMAFSIRPQGMSLDGLITDAGIGLEEIGHQIRAENNLAPSRSHHRNLEAIAAEIDHLIPFDGAAWATDSTDTYNDVKHADRPTPSAQDMRDALGRDRWVFRVWLANRLGFSDQELLIREWGFQRG